MRYEFFLGTTNTGLTPTFTRYVNAATGAAVTQPAIVEAGSGVYYFVESWSDPTITSISYVVTGGGIEAHDVISSSTAAAGSGVGGTGAASAPWLWTAGNILNTVAVETGLDEVADPYASGSAHFKQLRALLRTVGQELVQARAWKALVKEVSFTGTGSDTLFNLPADFSRFMDASGYRRADGEPLSNPLSSTEWQYLKARTASASVSIFHRMVGHRVQFYSAPALASVIYADYVSRYWVRSSSSVEPDLYQPAASEDVVVLDPLVVRSLLKVKWLDAKGKDSSAAREEYRSAFEGSAGQEPAPVLDVGGGSLGFRLLDTYNLPERLI